LESHPNAMAKPPQAAKRAAPRFYLVTPAVDDAARFAESLGRALAAADVAAVLLRLAPAGERELINRVKTLAQIVQDTGAALVLDGHPEIAARAGADGAHLAGIETFIAAVESLKPARIAGCGGLKSRDDAMAAGERGADYVLFGEPDSGGHRPAFPAIIERIEWWAELFTIPCVGFAAKPDEIEALAAAGADFIAYGETVWDDPRGPASALAEAARQIPAPETAV
jgi:thiamine-phosphate pyrophosphorylase